MDRDATNLEHSKIEPTSREYALIAIEKTKGWLSQFADNSTSEELRGVLAEKFHETCKRVGLTYAEFEKLWARTHELARNPAMAQFLLDTRACDSEFFVPWQNAVPHAVILEAAYGYGYDLRGNYRRIPMTDPFQVWVEKDAGFMFARWRDQYTADFLIKEQCRRPLFLGAGWLPELRYTAYLERGWTKDTHILCCDMDSTINKDFLFPPQIMPAVSQSITYVNKGLIDILMEAKARNYRFDGVFAKGVMSYCLDSLKTVIATVCELLEPGRSFMFDLQATHWSMERNGYVFGWGADGAIVLLSAKEIVRTVNNACENIPHTSIAYVEDPTDQEPVGVVVTIIK